MGTGYPSRNVMIMWGDDMRYASSEAAERQFLLGNRALIHVRALINLPGVRAGVDKASSLPLSKPCALTRTNAPARALSLTRPHARALARTHTRTAIMIMMGYQYVAAAVLKKARAGQAYTGSHHHGDGQQWGLILPR